MTALLSLYATLTDRLARLDALLPLTARFLFAAILLMYFWVSAVTKLGAGVFGFLSPSANGYAQIFPKATEAVGYDISQLGAFHWLVVSAGTWAEFILPLLIVVGLFTRLAALGMIGFIIVQSLTDLFGHGAISDAKFLGAWFDKVESAPILDQRSLWIFLLLVLVVKGAGCFSLDRRLKNAL